MMQRDLFIVIADDDRMVMDAVAISLEADGKIKIVKATTLKQAVYCLNEYRARTGRYASAALVDLELPDAKGTEAICKILDVSPDTAVIAYTGHPEYEEEALKSGAISFIVKGSPNAYGKALIHEIRTSVIKNDIRLCHLQKNMAIKEAREIIKDVEGLASGEYSVNQLMKKQGDSGIRKPNCP